MACCEQRLVNKKYISIILYICIHVYTYIYVYVYIFKYMYIVYPKRGRMKEKICVYILKSTLISSVIMKREREREREKKPFSKFTENIA
ncbi:hypothetical protein PUN28_002597 [Cardiocondyla obscurior]|uniref:Uncharacterized protein n=1 Tax=Cardiocondyla obscurior TaxID=286306 RepID=A0AAW2GV34_9HYME